MGGLGAAARPPTAALGRHGKSVRGALPGPRRRRRPAAGGNPANSVRTQSGLTPGSKDLITLNEESAEARLAGVSGGVAHFGFRLTNPGDLDAAIQEVEAAGGKLIRRDEHGPGIPFAYVADPDG